MSYRPEKKLNLSLILFIGFIVLLSTGALLTHFFQQSKIPQTTLEVGEPLLPTQKASQLIRIDMAKKEDITVFERGQSDFYSYMGDLNQAKIKNFFTRKKTDLTNLSLDRPNMKIILHYINQYRVEISVGLINPIDQSMYIYRTDWPNLIFQTDIPAFLKQEALHQ